VSPAVSYRLARLITIVQERLLWREELCQVKQMHQWVLDAEHILCADFLPAGMTKSNATVGHQFDTWRQTVTRQLTEGLLSPLQQGCLEQMLHVFSNQRMHLIQCYDREGFPRTNNEMERQIRGIKTRYRRISGRKNWNNYLLRYGRYVAYYDWWQQDAELELQFLQAVAHLDRVNWRKHRRESRAARSSQLKRFRFRRKPASYLATLEARWEAAAPTSVLP
jgi:hypothetical protein